MEEISNISKEEYTENKLRFIKELQTIINTWISENQVRTVASLARGARVSDVAVRRLLNNDRKIVNESVFNLIAYIYGHRSFTGIAEALRNNNRSMVLEWFIKYYSYMKKAPFLESHIYTPVCDIVAADPMVYFVYSVVLGLERVSEEHFQKEFGWPAGAALKKLLEKGLLSQKENMVTIEGETIHLKFTKEQVAHLLSNICGLFFKPDHDHNAQHLETGTLSKEGYGDLINLHVEFGNSVQNLYRTKPGDIPVISAGFSDTLTARPYFNDENK